MNSTSNLQLLLSGNTTNNMSRIEQSDIFGDLQPNKRLRTNDDSEVEGKDLEASEIPGLDASKTISGVFNSARIPPVDLSLTTGMIPSTVAYGTAGSVIRILGGQFLFCDQKALPYPPVGDTSNEHFDFSLTSTHVVTLLMNITCLTRVTNVDALSMVYNWGSGWLQRTVIVKLNSAFDTDVDYVNVIAGDGIWVPDALVVTALTPTTFRVTVTMDWTKAEGTITDGEIVVQANMIVTEPGAIISYVGYSRT